MYRNPRLVKALGRLNIVHYTLVGIVITVVVVSGFSVYFHGHVTKDYLITGTFTCVVVSLFVVGVLKIHQRALNLEITRRQAAEQEKDRLIEQLEQSLLMQQELAELKVREKERELLLTVRNEKLKTLHQAMAKVLHYVNNLANNLQLVALEYRRSDALSERTLHTLDAAIEECSQEMRLLARTEDPFEEEPFRVKL